jgi:subtilisin family serine protease
MSMVVGLVRWSRSRAAARAGLAMSATALAVLGSTLFATRADEARAQQRRPIAKVPKPTQHERPVFKVALIEASNFIHAVDARDEFKVDGTGLAVAVLDTGLNTAHVDFQGNGRIPASRNFVSGKADDTDVSDGNGHGTNVGGIVVAHSDHTGIAPGANIVPIKVLDDDGGGNFNAVDQALAWILAHHDQFKITVVNLSLGDQTNHQDDDEFASDSIREKIKQLRDAKVATVIAAGNDWHTFNPSSANGPVSQGMAYPAIFRETVSVGAVYDINRPGPIVYQDDTMVDAMIVGRITPFSQRIHRTLDAGTRTDIFAPGAPVKSSGIVGPHGESEEQGTSQASPVTAGVVLLLQAYFEKQKGAGQRPTIDQIEDWLRQGPESLKDLDDGKDNVKHTGLNFPRLDALISLRAAKMAIGGH